MNVFPAVQRSIQVPVTMADQLGTSAALDRSFAQTHCLTRQADGLTAPVPTLSPF